MTWKHLERAALLIDLPVSIVALVTLAADVVSLEGAKYILSAGGYLFMVAAIFSRLGDRSYVKASMGFVVAFGYLIAFGAAVVGGLAAYMWVFGIPGMTPTSFLEDMGEDVLSGVIQVGLGLAAIGAIALVHAAVNHLSRNEARAAAGRGQ